MVYNTAFCFLLFGVGMLTLLTPYKRFAIIPGLLILTITSITIIEYLFNVQMGLDELFIKDFLFTNTISPGRMSPNSAMAHTIGGIFLLLLSFREIKKTYYYILLILVVVLFILSTTSLLGYAINLSGTYKWYGFIPMALHTSLGFFIMCIGLGFLIYKKYNVGEINISKALPLFAFLCVMSFTLLIWRASYQDAFVDLQHFTNLESEKLKSNLEQDIKESILELKSHEEWGLLRTNEEWVTAVESYKQMYPWYGAIGWVSPEGEVRHSTSLSPKKNFLAKGTHLEKNLFDKFLMNKEVSLIPINKIKSELLLCLPFYKGTSLEGFIVGLINTNTLFETIINESRQDGFIVNITNSVEHKKAATYIRMSAQDIITEVDLRLYDHNLHFTVKPTADFIKEQTDSLLSYLVLIIGFFIGVLLALVIRSRMISKKQQKILEETQHLLREKFEESIQLNNTLSLLKSMADELQSSVSLANACEVISHYASLLIPHSSGAIYLNEESEKTLTKKGEWGEKPLDEICFSVQKCNFLPHSFSTFHGQEVCELLCEKTTLHKPHSLDHNSHYIPLFDKDKILGIFIINAEDSENLPQNLIETLINQIKPALANIKLRELLKSQATRDPLTNLFNRRYLDESLPRELYQAKRYMRDLSLLMIDIDHFKKINDTFGHKGGDKVLKGIANLLETKSRKGDIVCRFGGEEFLIVLQETSSENALKRATQIKDEVSTLQFSTIGEDLKHVTVSIGISSFPGDGDTMEDLILIADQSLYRAKANGRNRVEVGKDRTEKRSSVGS